MGPLAVSSPDDLLILDSFAGRVRNTMFSCPCIECEALLHKPNLLDWIPTLDIRKVIVHASRTLHGKLVRNHNGVVGDIERWVPCKLHQGPRRIDDSFKEGRGPALER